MFTGIIEEVGEVVGLERRGDSAVLTVHADTISSDLVHGASIAVNGVCLTVVGWDGPAGEVRIDFDVMGETLARSVIGSLDVGDRVNLERAVRADARLDGHVVQGHVDGTGVVLSRTPGDAWEAVRFGLPAELARFVAEKGSIAVDGVSLTVSEVGPDFFGVGLIPETLRATTLGGRLPGDPVNLEVDVLAKYVARLMETVQS
ncbi:riboflavin synthase [Jatrophihabitans endophyticus]|uniref:riboflavin synthase n=1 Tax=Jatrophihabitans endophyticus TaxID=1206085 RepID=UPI0019F6EA8E|nr:riboflavin synthase [Jatrophihabitans endophyticus]MBE7189105.1 riboflavin synthase [Jatrophihabitans endophyticus]